MNIREEQTNELRDVMLDVRAVMISNFSSIKTVIDGNKLKVYDLKGWIQTRKGPMSGYRLSDKVIDKIHYDISNVIPDDYKFEITQYNQERYLEISLYKKPNRNISEDVTQDITLNITRTDNDNPTNYSSTTMSFKGLDELRRMLELANVDADLSNYVEPEVDIEPENIEIEYEPNITVNNYEDDLERLKSEFLDKTENSCFSDDDEELKEMDFDYGSRNNHKMTDYRHFSNGDTPANLKFKMVNKQGDNPYVTESFDDLDFDVRKIKDEAISEFMMACFDKIQALAKGKDDTYTNAIRDAITVLSNEHAIRTM